MDQNGSITIDRTVFICFTFRNVNKMLCLFTLKTQHKCLIHYGLFYKPVILYCISYKLLSLINSPSPTFLPFPKSIPFFCNSYFLCSPLHFCLFPSPLFQYFWKLQPICHNPSFWSSLFPLSSLLLWTILNKLSALSYCLLRPSSVAHQYVLHIRLG